MEEDTRLTVLLRDHGKLSVVSRGSMRPGSKLKAVQEPFSEADFQIYVPAHGTHGRLTGGKLIDSHQPLRQRYDCFETACKCCEVVEMLLPFRAPSPEVFDILRQILGSLQMTVDPRQEWVRFVVRMLECLGHGDLSSKVESASMDQSLAVVDEELKQILPWRLKSELSPIS